MPQNILDMIASLRDAITELETAYNEQYGEGDEDIKVEEDEGDVEEIDTEATPEEAMAEGDIEEEEDIIGERLPEGPKKVVIQ